MVARQAAATLRTAQDRGVRGRCAPPHSGLFTINGKRPALQETYRRSNRFPRQLERLAVRALPLIMFIALTSAVSAKPATPPAAPELADAAKPVKIGAVMPAGAQVIVQPNGAYGIVIENSRVIVVEPKSRKVIEILESGT
jgi:hypothetical protein